ncbi:mechanosensitive ion channel domain-containing protein [Pseudomonas aeruginosa]
MALARNLPGLLEVLVLQRLTLAQGSAYATTTLLSYAISGIGIVSALSTLGVSWDRAAMAGGGALGRPRFRPAGDLLQLRLRPDHPFERPVRIGDVVTIGNLSGTVSRIRIRATTITDFDRKEIIVPNQTFITGQLVNWSLSDTVTRVTIKIGLAYETDLPLARKLMMQAVKENPRVLRDPEPLLYFLTISASTFDYESALPRPRTGRPQPLYRRDPDEDRHQLPRTQDRHGFQPGRCVRQEPPGPAGPAVRRRAAAQRRRQSARAQGPGRSRRTDPLNLRV